MKGAFRKVHGKIEPPLSRPLDILLCKDVVVPGVVQKKPKVVVRLGNVECLCVLL